MIVHVSPVPKHRLQLLYQQSVSVQHWKGRERGREGGDVPQVKSCSCHPTCGDHLVCDSSVNEWGKEGRYSEERVEGGKGGKEERVREAVRREWGKQGVSEWVCEILSVTHLCSIGLFWQACKYSMSSPSTNIRADKWLCKNATWRHTVWLNHLITHLMWVNRTLADGISPRWPWHLIPNPNL